MPRLITNKASDEKEDVAIYLVRFEIDFKIIIIRSGQDSYKISVNLNRIKHIYHTITHRFKCSTVT